MKKKRTSIAIIQARMSSIRLPGKVMKLLSGQPMIWHIVERARRCKHVDRVIVATSIEPSDDPLVDFCISNGIECFRGSLKDVRSRYVNLLRMHKADFYIRITGDCPLIDPVFIDFQLEALIDYDGDMIKLDKSCPVLEGQGVHSSRSLFLTEAFSQHVDDLEHVGSRYFAENQNDFNIVGIRVPDKFKLPSWRLTVDEPRDYELMSTLYDELWDTKNIIPLEKAIDFLNRNPKIACLNSKVSHSLINQELVKKQEEILLNMKVWVNWSS